jgi:hypothetical protein
MNNPDNCELHMLSPRVCVMQARVRARGGGMDG